MEIEVITDPSTSTSTSASTSTDAGNSTETSLSKSSHHSCEIATFAVQMVMEHDNDYLRRLLTRRLDNTNHPLHPSRSPRLSHPSRPPRPPRSPSRLPISLSQLIYSNDYQTIDHELNTLITIEQPQALTILDRQLTQRETHRQQSSDCETTSIAAPSNDCQYPVTQNSTVRPLPLTDSKAPCSLVSLETDNNINININNSDQNRTVTSWIINTLLQEKLKDRKGKENADFWKYVNGILAVLLPIATGLIEYYLTRFFNSFESN